MSGENDFNRDTASDIAIDITNELSENGLATEEYQLYQFVDLDALAQLLHSVKEPYHISFYVKDKKVILTETGVSVQHNQMVN